MPFQMPVYGAIGFGGLTQSAGTVIQLLVPPKLNAFTRLTSFSYISGGTAHTLTVLQPLSSTTLSSAAAAGQAVVNLTADPGTIFVGPNGAASKVAANAIAANDYGAIELADGTFHLCRVSSVSSLAITMTANIPTGGAPAGARFWFFGITTDLNPYTGLAHPAFKPTVSTRTVYSDAIVGVLGSNNKYEPMLFNSDNATAAGTLDQVTAAYTTK